jgi:hypothetical protein
MVFDGPICALFTLTDLGTLYARERAICDFGPSALLTHTQEKNKPMADATETFKFRLPLRQIAKALGKVEKELDAIRMTVPQLQELIKQDVPNIAEMSYDEVQALAADVNSGNRPSATPAPAVVKPAVAQKTAPAAEPAAESPAPVKRGPGRPPKPKTPGSAAPTPAPVEEVVEETPVEAAVEEPVIHRAPPKAGPKVPLRRGSVTVVETPVSAVETHFAAPAASAVVADLGPVLAALEDIRKRIDVIGQQSDLINTAVKDLNTRVKRVEDAFGTQDDRISAIVGALSFLYATASGDEDGDSIENIDWSTFLGNG